MVVVCAFVFYSLYMNANAQVLEKTGMRVVRIAGSYDVTERA